MLFGKYAKMKFKPLHYLWLWQFLTHVDFNIMHAYCHTVEDMSIWSYYRWRPFTCFSSTADCSKVLRWAGRKSCSQIRSSGWGLGNSERAACQMLRSRDTRKNYKQSIYLCILAINKHKPHHLQTCIAFDVLYRGIFAGSSFLFKRNLK